MSRSSGSSPTRGALARENSGEADLRELAVAEIPALERRARELREAILLAMIPPEASDSRNTVMEIRAGTGGEEAALFAAELSRCYQRYADSQGWKVQPMSSSYTETGRPPGGQLPGRRAPTSTSS